MKNIKSYEDFCNEEINWKKALTGAALGAGLSLTNPAISQTDSTLSQRIDKEVVKMDTVSTFVSDNENLTGYYYTQDGKWHKTNKASSLEITGGDIKSIKTMFVNYDSTKYFVIIINESPYFGYPIIILNDDEYNRCVDSLSNYNKNIIVNGLLGETHKDVSLQDRIVSIIEHDKKIKSINDKGNTLPLMLFKSGYYSGEKVVRFIIDTSDSPVTNGLSDREIEEFDNAYYEISFDDFKSLFIKKRHTK